MKKIAWGADLHLEYKRDRIDTNTLNSYLEALKKQEPDALLLGGDIGTHETTPEILSILAQETNTPIYFTLGNHDFYNNFDNPETKTVKKTIEKIHNLANNHRTLSFLDTNTTPIKLTEDTALIGETSWADAKYGTIDFTKFRICDQTGFIYDFIGLKGKKLEETMNQLGEEVAGKVAKKIDTALGTYNNIILLTHIPPFKEGCFYNGKPQTKYAIPFFSCKSLGETLIKKAKENPQSNFTVLCGHTHSYAKIRPAKNLEAITTDSRNKLPNMTNLITINSNGQVEAYEENPQKNEKPKPYNLLQRITNYF